MRVPLLGGFYQAKSIIANAQSCINLYPEINPEDSPTPVTTYPTAGLNVRAVAPINTWRCLYQASNGVLYGVAGQFVYLIDSNWNLAQLGMITSTGTAVSMIDNGLVIVVVDGTQFGYSISLTTDEFASIVDSAFYGADRADYLDTFFVFNQPGTRNMYSSPSNWIPGIPFDPLAIAGKSGYPDPLQGLIVMHREIWLIGTLTTEIWYDAGAPDFPFAILPGTFIEHGCIAKYSIIKAGLEIYWLSKDLRGNAVVLRGANYQAERVSTFAIENEFQKYANLADCITYTYQYEGHVFVDFVFPSANKTWSYDTTVKLWHENVWTNNDGIFNRHRANCAAFAYNTIVCGDWENGNLYHLDVNTYTDNGQPIVRLRSFPHLLDDEKRVVYDSFIIDMDAGQDEGTIDGSTDQNPPTVSLRWSNDKGRTFGNYVQQSMGGIGQTLTTIQFRRLGLARDRVFEVSWSIPAKTALQGAFIDSHSSVT